MGKISYIDIAGKRYPMSFSLMASKKLAEKYGGIQKALKKISTVDNSETIEAISYMLELLISQGCAYKNYFEKDVPTSETDSVEDGKWMPIPKEVIEIAIGLSDLETIVEKIGECVSDGKQNEIEAKASKKGKNAEATQE